MRRTGCLVAASSGGGARGRYWLTSTLLGPSSRQRSRKGVSAGDAAAFDEEDGAGGASSIYATQHSRAAAGGGTASHLKGHLLKPSSMVAPPVVSGAKGGVGKQRLVSPPKPAAVTVTAPAATEVNRPKPPALAEALSGAGTGLGAGAATPAALFNPFQGIHENLTRSYRLDQLVEAASERDLMFARQEKKSTAFSFMRVETGVPLYDKHWSSLPMLQAQYMNLLSGISSSADSNKNAKTPPSALLMHKRGVPIPGYTLFNNDLGMDAAHVHSSAPLIVAQRLLMLPDAMRHFHALCGREDVPCDFFADVDLPDTSPKDGEAVLLEILNYLEVRLPGIGFTDPFFLVLSNDVPHKDKVSYHIHARSMTFAADRSALSLNKATKLLCSQKTGAGVDDSDEVEGVAGADGADDDLTDLVRAVEGAISGGSGATVMTKNSDKTQSSKKSTSAATKVIAFQDYRTVKLVADEVNQTLGRSVIDENCYRAHGMLRCAFNYKLNSAQNHDYLATKTSRMNSTSSGKRLTPLISAKDPALQRRLSGMEEILRTMTDPEILELTFCNRILDDADTTRHVHDFLKETLPRAIRGPQRQMREELLKAATRHSFRLVKPRHVLGPQYAQAQEFDAYGNVVSPYLTEAAKWMRYKSAVAKLRTLPPRAAESHDVWVRVGLALHNFSNEDHVFEEWVRFSLRCPQKYARDVCRKKWVQFERNPDALNWRRGFNYLNSTVWKQV